MSETTAQDVMKAQRFPIPLELYCETSSTATMKAQCEIQVQAIEEYVARQKLVSDCKEGKVAGDACKCVRVTG